jgi:cellulose synthase/poly-beta-1,6-N-acetylglucosamine synthase-like glycosyltransferase
MNVIIPSYKRANKLIGKKYFSMAKYCVPESQAKEYEEEVGKNRVIAIPDEHDGSIVKKRNWILENIPRPLIMIDDDVKALYYWDDRINGYLRKIFPKELVNELFQELVSMAMQFDVKLFGLAQNTDDRTYKEFAPFNLTKIVLGPFQGHLDHDLRFDEKAGTKDDYDMCLQHLRKYKKVLRFNKYAYECNHGDNKGGIVSYRSMDVEQEHCKYMMKKMGNKSHRIQITTNTNDGLTQCS